MAPSTPEPTLDHIVILVPHHTLQNLPSWLTDAFTVSPGGRHADNVTENKLVLFRDGVYLELIAFIPGQEAGRRAHRWGRRREGHIIDWAHTLILPTSGGDQEEVALEAIRERVRAAGTGITYATPQPGGRAREPDGVGLKWVTCSPERRSTGGDKQDEFVGGEVPFWCLDRTPRDWRVPYRQDEDQDQEDKARHPSGAVGVRGVTVYVRDGALFQALKGTYDALQGREGAKLLPGAEGFRWDLQVPATTTTQVGEDDVETRGQQQQPSSTNTTTTLSLIRVGEGGEEDDAAAPRRGWEVSVELSLFTSEGGWAGGKVGGTLGDEGWAVEFGLVGAS